MQTKRSETNQSKTFSEHLLYRSVQSEIADVAATITAAAAGGAVKPPPLPK